MIRTLVVDDEPLARERLRSLLAAESDFQLVGECPDGRSVIEFVEKNPVDLILLDIQMPAMDGFQVVRQLAANRLPAIVFVTAFDQYALHAFEVHAIDYLLKPVEAARMKSTLDRVRSGQQRQALREYLQLRVDTLLSEIEASRGSEHILLKTDGAYSFLEPREIDWVQSAGNYVEVHAGSKSVFLRETLCGAEKKLRAYGFVRISRSVVVNRTKIRTVRPLRFGEYSVELTNATRLVLARGYRHDFFDSVKQLG